MSIYVFFDLSSIDLAKNLISEGKKRVVSDEGESFYWVVALFHYFFFFFIYFQFLHFKSFLSDCKGFYGI